MEILLDTGPRPGRRNQKAQPAVRVSSVVAAVGAMTFGFAGSLFGLAPAISNQR